MAENENINRGAGGVGGWPDDIDDRILIELADYHWTVKRSLRAAAFGWPAAGTAERAAYIDELAELRKKEARAWETYLARPVNKETP